MYNIRPITDLRNNFSDISKIVHEDNEPVFLTKNGYGDMVVMSVEKYSAMVEEQLIAQKLQATTKEQIASNIRYDFNETSKQMRNKLSEQI